MLVLDFLSELAREGDMTPRRRALGVLKQAEGIDFQEDRQMVAKVCSHLRKIEGAQ
jgi:hypothetical protein